MRGGGLCTLFLALGFVSCGLETVPSLNSPDVNYLASELNSERSLSFVHSSARYADSDFVGYQIFYKIYPVSSDFTRLLADRTSLSTSPTVSQLINLGYRSFTFSSSNGGTSSGTEALLVQNLGDGDTVTVDFNDFLQPQVPVSTQPMLMINGSPASKPYLYRAPVLVGTGQQTFGALRTSALIKNTSQANNGLPVDISTTITPEELLSKAFEINIFISAYGMTPALVEVLSSPVPWGVIRTIRP